MSWPRVLANAADHPYVERLHGGVARLVGRDEAAPGGQVRPFDPDWVADHSWAWDIAHLHLGLDETDPLDLGLPPDVVVTAGRRQETAADVDEARIVDVVEAHRRSGVPVVMTVHAVAGPDDPIGARTIALLHRLDTELAAVLTLTQGCARYLQQRLARPVRRIPHGPVVDAGSRARLRAHRRRVDLAGAPLLLHAGSLPPDLLWQDVLTAAARTSGDRGLRVLVHADRADQVARAAAGLPNVRLVVHPVLTRARLERAVADAGALVLAHRRGCHSTLLELAADIGTPVIATDVGWRCQQHPTIPVPVADGRIDVDVLAARMDSPMPARPLVRECERERDDHAFRSHHERLYHRLLMGRADGLLPPGDLGALTAEDPGEQGGPTLFDDDLLAGSGH